MKRSLSRLLAALVLYSLIGCAPGPKPATLLTLERMRKGPAVGRMKERTPRIWKDSTNFYRLSQEAWEDGEDVDAREFALISTILYRTAELVGRRTDAEARVTATETKAAKAREERDHWHREKERIEQAVLALQAQLSMSIKLSQLEQKRAQEVAAMQTRLEAEQGLVQARKRHADLQMRLKDTEKVAASTHAPGHYNKARNLLEKADLELDRSHTELAQKTMEAAAAEVVSAVQMARPRFEALAAQEAADQQKQKLVSQAHEVGASTVRVEPRGVVLVIHGIFVKKKTAIVTEKHLLLDKIGRLLNQFPSYRVLIEGHTSGKGKAQPNLSLSQSRANVVVAYYVAKGIAASRLQAAGFGENSPLVENKTKAGRAQNKRIEIVVLFPKRG